MATNERLMKFTGDLKALPYRELMVFSQALEVHLLAATGSAGIANALVITAEQINPDVDPEADKNRTRPGLADRLRGG